MKNKIIRTVKCENEGPPDAQHKKKLITILKFTTKGFAILMTAVFT